jgi:hypothetical protein
LRFGETCGSRDAAPASIHVLARLARSVLSPSLLTVSVAIAIGVSGCGGGGGGEGNALTKPEYASKANAICSAYFQKLHALPQPQTLSGIVSYTDKQIPALESALAQLRELKPPSAEQSTADEFLKRGNEALEEIREIRTAAKDGQTAKVQRIAKRATKTDRRIDTLARLLGASTCAQS